MNRVRDTLAAVSRAQDTVLLPPANPEEPTA